jgi:hypothetical protein
VVDWVLTFLASGKRKASLFSGSEVEEEEEEE